MKIVTVQEMRSIEQASVDNGVSLDRLQENAARAIAGSLGPHETRCVAMVGPGNNGRDALIAAALHAESGGRSRAFLMPGVASEDVRARLAAAGGELIEYQDDSGLGSLRAWLEDADVVLDGLLGIGIHGPAREPMATVISAVNEVCGARMCDVLAVDLPSGIDADTGEVPGAAIRATRTLSLGCVKAGLLNPPAVDFVGLLEPLEIGLPPGTDSSIPRELTSPTEVASALPPRPLSAHKGTFGRVLVVAGSMSFVGAPFLVGAAAARAGCGIVTLAVPEWQRVPLAALLPEATYLPLRDTVDLGSAEANARAIGDVLPACDALVIGPGLGQGDAQTRLVVSVLEMLRDTPGMRAVVDADAINALARVDGWWSRMGKGLVLTPHPGEMSRLTGMSAAEINASRLRVAGEAAAKWGQTVILKGAYTVIAAPDGLAWVNPAAVPALATGGSGDVLSGITGGLMAQGSEPLAAARSAVYLHSLAAQGALARNDADRLLASDLLPEIPRATMRLASMRQGITRGSQA